MRIATSAETARNTRAVASQRSMRRTSLGSDGACALPKKRCFPSTCNFSNHFLLNCRLVRYRIASHIIDKKDGKQAKLWEGGPKWVFPFPARDLLPRARVTSVTSISPKPILRWNGGLFTLRTQTKLWAAKLWTAAVAACLATLVLA